MLKTFVADGDLAGSVTVKEYEGRYFPPDMPDIPSHLKRLQSFDADGSDVIICAYPKSGFHRIWDVVTMLINNTSSISKELPGKYSLELGLRKVEQSPPRVLGSHLYYEELPQSIRQRKCKIINVIRDPRAVAVSSYHFFTKIKRSKWNGTWAGYLNLFLNGKGTEDDWKSLFTLQQNAEFEQIYKERMQYNRLQLKSKVSPGSNDTGCIMCVKDTRYDSKL